MDVGPKRDLVGDLAAAVRNETSLKFGLYHSWFEWFNPLWLQVNDLCRIPLTSIRAHLKKVSKF